MSFFLTCIAASRIDERRISVKSLPTNPSLEFLKKEAKALRALHRQGDIACCELIRSHDSAFKNKSNEEILATHFSINDAQRIIAREYGYTSWATLKEYIESLLSPLYHGVSNKQVYKQLVAESYDKRAEVYDNHVWAKEWCDKLVQLFPPKAGEVVLDLGCGSGNIAFSIADTVGPAGSIIAVDFAHKMIAYCNKKLKQTRFTNLIFEYGDAEQLDYPPNHFDRIYASAILPWLINPQAALRHWFELLKPGGWIALTVWPSNSFVWGDGERQALRRYGIDITVHEFSGTKEKTRKLMELAGYRNIDITVDERGRWVEADYLKGEFSASSHAIGQYPHPLENVAEDILQKASKDFLSEVDRLTTEQGIWHDMTTFFVYAQK
jgi:ubiquinone/menaquinone biosynthesis C-methylase UbiE